MYELDRIEWNKRVMLRLGLIVFLRIKDRLEINCVTGLKVIQRRIYNLSNQIFLQDGLNPKFLLVCKFLMM